MLPILDRYLLAELAKALLATVLILLLVLVSHTLLKLMKEAAVGAVHAEVLLPLLGLKLIGYLPQLLPPALFLAVLVTLGRLHQQHEIVALEASGVGPLRLYRGFFLFALPLALLVGWVALLLQPWAENRASRIADAQREAGAELAAVVPGRFNEYSRGDLILYAGQRDPKSGRFSDVFVQNRLEGALGIIRAESAYLEQREGGLYFVLEAGRRYAGEPGSGRFRLVRFDRYAIRLVDTLGATDPFNRRATLVLWHEFGPRDQALLQARLSAPLAVVTLLIVSLPLSRALPRGGSGGRVVLALLVYFSYYNLEVLAQQWIRDGLLSLGGGLVLVHGTLLLIAAAPVLLRRYQRRRAARRGLAEARA